MPYGIVLVRVRVLDWSRSRGQNPECWDLAVKDQSDSEPRRGAGEPRGQLFSLRALLHALQGRVFLLAVSARCRAQAGAVCVQKLLSCQLALRVMTRRYLRELNLKVLSGSLTKKKKRII